MIRFKTNELLELGFISIPNTLLNDKRLSYRAIGCYCSIVHAINSLGIVEPKTLVNDVTSEEMIKLSLQELISFGWVNLKGEGENYTYSLNIVSSKPNAKNKFEANGNDIEINKNIAIEDSDEEARELIEHLRNISIRNVTKGLIEQLLEIYNYKALRHCIGLLHSEFGSTRLKNMNFEMAIITKLEVFGEKALQGNIFELEKPKKDNLPKATHSTYTPIVNNKATKFNNYHQREYDYEKLEDEILGWD